MFLRLDPAIDPSRKDLPATLYESGECGAGHARAGKMTTPAVRKGRGIAVRAGPA